MERTYLCIDIKSFFASVECVERGLDPMQTRLVVADLTRSDKTICLAVTPALKALGVKNRCRVFEIPKSIDYITAPPRMQKYIDYAAEIYGVYIKYVSPDDIHVYSIDEAFLDVTSYLPRYKKTPREMAVFLMDEVLKTVGVRSTCGIGTNLYLAKIALDITAKHSPDFIGQLDETSYRETLWEHTPITDFWRVGRGTAQRLASRGIYTMGGVARARPETLYKLFGIDAELLIDHAYGREPTTIADIKSYSAKSHMLTSGQVLMRDYAFDEALIVLKEMLQSLCLDMCEKKLLSQTFAFAAGYSNRLHLPNAHASVRLSAPTNSPTEVISAVAAAFARTADRSLPVRRLYVSAFDLRPDDGVYQLSLFDDGLRERDRAVQQTVSEIRRKYGKNSLLRVLDLMAPATARERNGQIGGHKSGDLL